MPPITEEKQAVVRQPEHPAGQWVAVQSHYPPVVLTLCACLVGDWPSYRAPAMQTVNESK
jgi:hypothetical protein